MLEITLHQSSLLPTSGLQAWHRYQPAEGAGHIIGDYSGNNRTLTGNAANSPVLAVNVLSGRPGWYFDGTRDPVKWNGNIVTKHIFILASFDAATFSGFEGLLSDQTNIGMLAGSGAGTTKFFNFNVGVSYTYRKNDIIFPETNQQAPVGNKFALIELQYAGGAGLDGIQIGQDRNIAARRWKGYFIEQLFYDRILSFAERQRVMLYFNLWFELWKPSILNLPLFFPSDDLLDFRRSRFYAAPIDYAKTTDAFEFEDGGKTFNEVAAEGPRRWDYDYLNRTPQQIVIFDEFYKQVHLTSPFYFRDKYGTVWNNVRVENYNRNHEAHKSWSMDSKFRLVRYNDADAAIAAIQTFLAGKPTQAEMREALGILPGSVASLATETSPGIAELATQNETDAGANDNWIVTPLKLKTSVYAKRKFAANVGDGINTVFDIAHNFNTFDFLAQVYDQTAPQKNRITVDILAPNQNTTRLIFTSTPALNQFRVVIMA